MRMSHSSARPSDNEPWTGRGMTVITSPATTASSRRPLRGGPWSVGGTLSTGALYSHPGDPRASVLDRVDHAVEELGGGDVVQQRVPAGLVERDGETVVGQEDSDDPTGRIDPHERPRATGLSERFW